ncbi:response regulator [Planctomicrobium piriforme]|uniref:Two-component system, chemotaxis family, response regulator CheY n=1 Tax=Planctomicrobium piriforme TaxID=1576369 RepID=A0A1I3CJJ2_9PLAN|nr:response regulator [Planctomicrobium piriforme]SFH74672.1 two-component system, chemotaxis family, response regulator CheY [Planctomicrobium piriforme]
MSANRLMIVDDALIMRMKIKQIALAAGWQVVAEADDGKAAVERYQEHRPDLVTLDVVMPHQDGPDTLREILGINPEARIVMVSAVNQKAKLVECISAGAIDFIVKPFDPQRLKEFFEKQLISN